jgi:hypothetical protein
MQEAELAAAAAKREALEKELAQAAEDIKSLHSQLSSSAGEQQALLLATQKEV